MQETGEIESWRNVEVEALAESDNGMFTLQLPRQKIFLHVKSADRKIFEYPNDTSKPGAATLECSSAYGNLYDVRRN